IENIKQLQLQAALATAGSLKQIELQTANDLRTIDDKINSERALGQTKAVEKLQDERVARVKLGGQQEIAAQRQIADQTREIQNQAALAGLSTMDTINVREQQELDNLAILLNRQPELVKAVEDRKRAIVFQAANERGKLLLDVEQQGFEARLQAEANALE